VSRKQQDNLEGRVVRAARAALAAQHYVAPVDILVGIGWLPSGLVDEWRQGRIASLESAVQVTLGKLSSAMALFRDWAEHNGLRPSETVYVARTRDRRHLQFTDSGDVTIERAYRTHWFSPELSEARQHQMADKQNQAPELVVISALGEWTCAVCSGTGDLLLMEDRGPLCLRCADLDHLVFLPRGDAALTRRAKKASASSAVVVRFSRARKRYERQGALVEREALQQAERQCLTDEEARLRRRGRSAPLGL
jgi:hypothetical protein